MFRAKPHRLFGHVFGREGSVKMLAKFSNAVCIPRYPVVRRSTAIQLCTGTSVHMTVDLQS